MVEVVVNGTTGQWQYGPKSEPIEPALWVCADSTDRTQYTSLKCSSEELDRAVQMPCAHKSEADGGNDRFDRGEAAGPRGRRL
jgi:hypothetical protein